MEKNNSSVGSLVSRIVIFILIVAVIALTWYVYYVRDNCKSRESTKNEVHDNKNYTDKDNVSKDVDSELDSLVYEIFDIDYNVGYTSTFVLSPKMFTDNLSDKDKLYIALNNVKWDKVFGNTNNSQINSLVSAGTEVESSSIFSVNLIYNRLFNEFIDSYISFNECPTYIYDSQDRVYYKYSNGCGGTSDENIVYYKIKTIEDNGYAYQYVAFGLTRPSDTEGDEYYSDLNGTKRVYNINGLDGTSYEKFSQYRFVFEKNGDNYYYKKIEQLK